MKRLAFFLTAFLIVAAFSNEIRAAFFIAQTALSASYPGQAGHPVGFAATPSVAPASFAASNGQTWPGAYTSLTAWPGGTGAQTISGGTNATSGAGTAGNPWVFAFYDFAAGNNTTTISVSNAIFVGCRFQSNQQTGLSANVNPTGSNLTFIYSSFVPPTSLQPSPPNGAWPSAGVGAQIINTDLNYHNYVTLQANSYAFALYGFNITGPLTMDNIDAWGFTNFMNLPSGSTSQVTLQNSWLHDPANDQIVYTSNATGSTSSPTITVSATLVLGSAASNQVRDVTQGYALVGTLLSYTGSTITLTSNASIVVANGDQIAIGNVAHVDGPGYLNGGANPSNFTASGNTIAGIGNTNGIAMQGGSGSFNNLILTNNYFTGFGYFLFLGGVGANTNSTVTGNIFATDIPWNFGPLHSDYSAAYTVANANLWRNNKFKVYPGTAPASGATFSWSAGQDGQYVLPNQTLSASDWSN